MNSTSRIRDEFFTELHANRGMDSLVVIEGILVAELFNEWGELIGGGVSRNLVTSVGDQLYASRGAGLSTSNLPTGMRLGTGSTAPAKTGAGAAIVTYLSGSNKAFDATYPQAAGGVVTYKRTYAAGEATTASPITEAVINTDTITNDNATTATAANTISRVLVTGVAAKGATDVLALTWTHTILGA